jgi:hypothetical protein
MALSGIKFLALVGMCWDMDITIYIYVNNIMPSY